MWGVRLLQAWPSLPGRSQALATPNKTTRLAVLEGEAVVADVSWHFRWQALTCDESQRVAPWFRALAEATADTSGAGLPAPARLAFTEPNLAFAALDVSLGRARLRVELDLEFHRDRAQWRAGEPYLLDLVVTDATLIEAAAQWEAEIETYPLDSPRETQSLPVDRHSPRQNRALSGRCGRFSVQRRLANFTRR